VDNFCTVQYIVFKIQITTIAIPQLKGEHKPNFLKKLVSKTCHWGISCYKKNIIIFYGEPRFEGKKAPTGLIQLYIHEKR
jgi:hypothetical protein